jgi:hypothetical protein
MSEVQWCLATFVTLLVFLACLFALQRFTRAADDISIGEALEHYRKAQNWHERVFVAFLASPRVVKVIVGAGGFVALGSAAFACLSAICGSEIEVLRFIRDSVVSFISWLLPRLRGTP